MPSRQCYNFDAESHLDLYLKIHGTSNDNNECRVQQADPGPTDTAWLNFRAVMANAKSDVEAALGRAGAQWQGAAGQAMSSGVVPLAQWAEDARAAGVASHNGFQSQVSYYNGAKNDMPKPVEVTSTANDDYLGIPAGLTHLVGGQTDQDTQEAAAKEAKAKAVQVMDTYQANSSSATSTLGAFSPPPQVTVDVAPSRVGRSSVEQLDSLQKPSMPGGVGDTGSNQQSAPQHAVSPPPNVNGNPNGHATLPSGPGQGGQTNTAGNIPSPQIPSPIGSGSLPGRAPTGSGSQVPAGFGVGGLVGGGFGGGSGSAGGRGGPGGPGGLSGSANEPGGRGAQARAVGSGALAEDGPMGRGGVTARGVAGGAGMGGVGGARGSRGEDDAEHRSPDYLQETEDVWGDGVKVAPPVIGEARPQ